jgi:hypothetical protein
MPTIKRTMERSRLLSTTYNHRIDQIVRRKPATYEIFDAILCEHPHTSTAPSKITETNHFRDYIDAAL